MLGTSVSISSFLKGIYLLENNTSNNSIPSPLRQPLVLMFFSVFKVQIKLSFLEIKPLFKILLKNNYYLAPSTSLFIVCNNIYSLCHQLNIISVYDSYFIHVHLFILDYVETLNFLQRDECTK